MNRDSEPDAGQALRERWHMGIIDMKPGVIRYRGYAIEELIGRVTFAQVIWRMTRGELPGTQPLRRLSRGTRRECPCHAG